MKRKSVLSFLCNLLNKKSTWSKIPQINKPCRERNQHSFVDSCILKYLCDETETYLTIFLVTYSTCRQRSHSMTPYCNYRAVSRDHNNGVREDKRSRFVLIRVDGYMLSSFQSDLWHFQSSLGLFALSLKASLGEVCFTRRLVHLRIYD